MDRIIRSIRENPQLMSVLMIILGIVLFINPFMSSILVVRLIGWALIIGGAAMCVNELRRRCYTGIAFVDICGFVLALIAGIIIVANPDFIIGILPIAAGLIIIVNGVINLMRALDDRRHAYAHGWTGSAIMSALSIVGGILICANPFGSINLLVRIIGAVLVYNGVTNIWIRR